MKFAAVRADFRGSPRDRMWGPRKSDIAGSARPGRHTGERPSLGEDNLAAGPDLDFLTIESVKVNPVAYEVYQFDARHASSSKLFVSEAIELDPQDGHPIPASWGALAEFAADTHGMPYFIVEADRSGAFGMAVVARFADWLPGVLRVSRRRIRVYLADNDLHGRSEHNRRNRVVRARLYALQILRRSLAHPLSSSLH